jgi:Flp pilus assembly protein TadG
MSLRHRTKTIKDQRGQVLAMFVVMLPVLLMFAGLTLDLGMAYVTKTALSKAVDAAALTAMRNIKQGQSTAISLANNAFAANYVALGNVSPTPSVTIAFTNDASNNTVANVSASATLNTFFLGLMPGFKTVTVSSNAQTTRPKLIISLVLDKSGSMTLNGGATALPSAVTNFLSYFDDSSDQIAEVSFSSLSTVDVSIRTGFLSPITGSIDSMKFGGNTYTQAGLLDGQSQINSVTVVPGENVVKVVVFFTDGWANMVEDKLTCPALTLLNYGGCSPPEQAAGWCSGYIFLDPTTGASRSCKGATTFPSQLAGSSMPLNIKNVSDDAMYRSNLVATSMRSQGIIVYSIGLGDKISQSFLQQIANDPASPSFDNAQPIGAAVFAPSAADLQTVFQDIANKILLRLSQ